MSDKIKIWLHFLLVLVTLQISNSDTSLAETDSSGTAYNGSHRIIKRYTQRFPFPRPRLPTLGRPTLPLFPVFGPPPGQHGNVGGAFPNIRLRPPSDENLFTEEEDEDDEEETPKRKKKKKKKSKGKKQTPQPQPQLQSDSVSDSESQSHEEEDLQAKGESGELLKTKKNGKRTTTTTTTTTIGTTLRPKNHEDRTLIAMKNAILLKKAVIAKAAIIATIKKKKKAGLLYGLSKVGKVKGVSVKAPGIAFSVSSPNAAATSAVVSKAEEEEDEDEDEDDPDVMEGEKDEDDGDGEGSEDTDSVVVTPDTETTSAAAAVPNAGTTGVDASIMKPQMPMGMQQYTNSMMMQLQEQLQQKQQQMNPGQPDQYNQNQTSTEMLMQPQQQPSQYNQDGTQVQPQNPQLVQQYVQSKSPPEGQPVQTTTTTQYQVKISPSNPEIPELYKGSKKASKKAKKKKKAKPRPVNLGVKANPYKKFDQLANQAKSKLSTFIQIDVDFLRKDVVDRSDTEKFASRTLEVSEEAESEEKPARRRHGGGGGSKLQNPGNMPPPWVDSVWSREYPRRNHNSRENCGEGRRQCKLKPVWIVFNGRNPSRS